MQKVAGLVGEVLSVKDRYADQWATLQVDPDHEGAAPSLLRLTEFLTYITEARIDFQPGSRSEISKVVSSSNFAAQVLKLPAVKYRNLGDERDYFVFPDWGSQGWKNAIKNYGVGGNDQPTERIDGTKVELVSSLIRFIRVVCCTYSVSHRKNNAM